MVVIDPTSLHFDISVRNFLGEFDQCNVKTVIWNRNFLAIIFSSKQHNNREIGRVFTTLVAFTAKHLYGCNNIDYIAVG